MAAYSLDLRKRIVDAVEGGAGTISEIAAWFSVHQSFIYKLLRQKRERGDIAPLPYGGGAEAKLSEDHLMILTELVAKTPDATLAELRAQIKKRTRLEVSVPTIWRALAALGLSRKKTIRAAEAKPSERAKFAAQQKTLPVEKLVFVDEFGAHIAMTPAYARAPQGVRAEVREPFNQGHNISTIGALSLSGVGPALSIEGAIDTQIFDAYVAQFLAPSLLPGDIVLLDNVKFHYSQRAINLIEAAGARVIHLPAYSPDYNPIEECISKIKEALRRAKARTVRKLLNALARAIEKINIDDLCGWFAHCGYTFSLI